MEGESVDELDYVKVDGERVESQSLGPLVSEVEAGRERGCGGGQVNWTGNKMLVRKLFSC